MYLPKGNMAVYGDWSNAINLNINQLDWEEIGRIKASELEAPLPKQYKLEEEIDTASAKKQIELKKRYKNVYIPDGSALECVPSVEEVTLTKFKCSDTLKYYIQDSKEIQEDDYSSHSSLTSMFAPGKEEALKILPTMDEFLAAAKSFTTSNPDLGIIYLKLYDIQIKWNQVVLSCISKLIILPNFSRRKPCETWLYL